MRGDAVVYEVRLDVDRDAAGGFDAWLAQHVEEMCRFDGFEDAQIIEADGDETLRRIVRYRVASRDHLDQYLVHHAPRMRADGIARFGDAMRASRDIYPALAAPDLNTEGLSGAVGVDARTAARELSTDAASGAGSAGARAADLEANRPPSEDTSGLVCRNCDSPLSGQYCANCGQRDKHRMISLWDMMREFVGDLFEFDSRLWRTLHPLLLRPGKLTVEYLRGRRVYYTPPIRLYLVSSLLFFLVAFFDTQVGGLISIDAQIDEEVVIAPVVVESAESDPGNRGQQRESTAGVDEAVPGANETAPGASEAAPGADGVVPGANEVAPGADGTVPGADKAAPGSDGTAAGDGAATTADDETSNGIDGDIESLEDLREGCDDIDFGDEAMGRALARRITIVCEKLTAEGGANRFVEDFVDNLPGLMLVFLPFMALVLKLLYPLSRRYYVEHLLFLLHYHSFIFLAWTLITLLGRIPEFLPIQTVFGVLGFIGLLTYTPIYLFVAMRRVYGQSTWLRTIKFVTFGLIYLVSLGALFATMSVVTALAL